MAADDPGSGRGRILLVDDDRVFGLWAAQVLRRRGGFDLTHVLDPADALRFVRTGQWDLVITDFELPGMTGLELLRRVRLLKPSLPVAVMTAHADEDEAVAALRRAAVELLGKPMPPDEFLAKVTALVAKGGNSLQPTGADPGEPA